MDCGCPHMGVFGYYCLDDKPNCKLRTLQGKEQKVDKTRGAYIAAYRDGFMNGLDAKDKFKYCILGYEIGQLIDIIAKHEEQEMSNRILRRKEALDYCQFEGYKLFIDMLIKDKCIVLEDEPKRLVIDHVDAMPVIIKRNGKVVYEE